MDAAGPPVELLCVDDDTEALDALAAGLERVDGDFAVTTATGAADALNAFDHAAFDCIVSEAAMADIDGLAFLQAVRAENPEFPFVLFTAQGDWSLASDAIAAGVSEYIPRDGDDGQYRLLARRVRTIVERHRAMRTAAEDRASAETILDVAPDVILAAVDGRVVYANPAAGDFFEVRGRDALVGRSVDDILAGGSGVFEVAQATGQTAHTVETTVRRGDGSTVLATVTACTVTWDGAAAVVGIFQHATEADTRERRLEALHEATRNLMGCKQREAVAGIGVTAASEILGLDANSVHLVDDDGHLEPVVATDALCDLVGDLPSFTGSDSIAWRVYESDEVAALSDVRDDPDVHNPDTPIRSELYLPLGEHGILIAASPVADAFDEQDVALGQVLAANMEAALDAVVRDNELRERERELAAQNAHLERFASAVCHDLRNPLNVASGRLELVREECESEHINAIDRMFHRMEALIEDLLLIAKTGEAVSDLEPVDVGAVVEACWATVETGAATLVVETDTRILTDVTRLKQLLENLVRNAVEHSAASSPVQSDDAVGDGSEGVTVTVGDCPGGFYVADDGPGIPETDREKVFESGYSTRTDGTGFGLAIVRQIAEAHGWDVRVTESTDGGARFEITGVDTPET
ncbi:ATP-binding protein [Halomicroarcula sp. S1AR25-4]|uniref:ATP-binding protein n=1 Tax=Haloarcula sp. S1AR25-4 TaxID=2950538 RepID=UPI002875EB9B|nr:ATP-binding protein [Halomicroarcula sp. S1AR25-4]MDS0279448.1 ATP-binding protein [Halomicroarcula sp. S1AR25-4]